MRILLLARGIPSVSDPICGCFEMTQAVALAKAGHDVIFGCVSIGFEGRKNPITLLSKLGYKVCTESGVKIVRFAIGPEGIFYRINKSLYKMVMRWQYAMMYRKIAKMYGRPDVIYSHYLEISEYGVYLKEKFNIPLVAVEHWSEIAKEEVNPYILDLGRTVYPKVDQLVCVSQSLGKSIRRLFNRDNVVVNNMVDDYFFDWDKRSNNHDMVRFICVARFSEQKRQADIIEALRIVNKQAKNWTITFVGDGELLVDCKSLAESYGLKDKIEFSGWKSKDEIAKMLSEHDVFVLASGWETFGVVFIEAFAKGLPAIGTICGGPEEIITSDTGILINPKDIEALAASMLYMINHYKEYDPDKIRQVTYDRYSTTAIANRISQILEQTIDLN